MNTFWKDKVVFLTGASSGIGEALTIEIAKQGAVLGLLARREELLKALAAKCETVGGKTRIFACDVVDTEAVQTAADALRDEFGRIDILIANAGVSGKDKDTQAIKPEFVKKVIEINLMGAVNAVYACLPQMLERGNGQLVAISSLAGFRGLPKSAAYSASKGAMTNLFESIRLDVQDKGVLVTIIQPGFIKTPLTAGRKSKMPFLMELEDAVPFFLKAIEKKKKFAAFPWQLASIVRLGRIFPAWIYDKIARRATFRE
jgi:short-subunit dehydrogenase